MYFQEMFCFLISISFINFISASIWINHMRSKDESAIKSGRKCLSKLSRVYFKNPSITRTMNIAVFYSGNLSSPSADIEIDYLPWIHRHVANEHLDELQIKQQSDQFSIDGLVQVKSNAIIETDYYVLVTDHIEKLRFIMKNYVSRALSFNPGGKFLILYNQPSEMRTLKFGHDLTFRIFTMMYKSFNVANVVILYAISDKMYNIYVTDPFKNDRQCGSLEPILLDTCTNGILNRDASTTAFVQTSKVPNRLNNCTFKFCARYSPPFVNENCTTGLEVQILDLVQSILKFDINTFCTDKDRGEVMENGSWTQLMGMIQRDECDFVVGGFFPDNEVHSVFGITTPYLQDSYTWFAFVADLRPRWMSLVSIFEPNTWMVFSIITILNGCTWFTLGLLMPEKKPHKILSTCLLNSWSVFLGISANNRPQLTPLRIFFIMIALYGLNVTTIYTSKLITVFTNPAYDEQIDTIQEIIHSGLPYGGREEYHDWFENGNELDTILFESYNSSNAFLPSSKNLQDVRNGKKVMLLSRIYVISKGITGVYPFPDSVLTNPLEMIAEKGFPLLNTLSKVVMFMKDSGLMNKLHLDFIYNVTILEKIRVHATNEDQRQIVLTYSHVEGAFSLAIVGLSISCAIFLCELLIAWCMSTKLFQKSTRKQAKQQPKHRRQRKF